MNEGPVFLGAVKQIWIIAGAIIMAMCSRAYSYAEDARKAGTPIWGVCFAFNIIGAALCGFIAAGIAEYLHMGPTATIAGAAVAGQIGPKGLVALLARLIPR